MAIVQSHVEQNVACQLILLDVTLSFSTIGSLTILHQIIGTPIGSPLSPSLARACVTYFEIFRMERSKISKCVMGGRCTDDLLLNIIATCEGKADEIKNVFVFELCKDGLISEEDVMMQKTFLSLMLGIK